MLVEAKFEVHAHDLGPKSRVHRTLSESLPRSAKSISASNACFLHSVSHPENWQRDLPTSPANRILEKALQNHHRCGTGWGWKDLVQGPTALCCLGTLAGPSHRLAAFGFRNRHWNPKKGPTSDWNLWKAQIKRTLSLSYDTCLAWTWMFLFSGLIITQINNSNSRARMHTLRVEAWIMTVHHFQQHIHLILDELAWISAGPCRRIQEFLVV